MQHHTRLPEVDVMERMRPRVDGSTISAVAVGYPTTMLRVKNGSGQNTEYSM